MNKTNNYMGREYILKEENGIYRGYVQLDDNDDIFRLDYAEKMKIENDEDTNNRAWVENKCMDVINTLVEDNWFDDFDDNDDDWFDDDDNEEDYYD